MFTNPMQRLDDTDVVKSASAGGSMLMMHVPFAGSVKLKSFCVRGAEGRDKAPSSIKMWTNRDNITPSSAGKVPCVQEWNLQYDEEAKVTYNTKLSKFQNVSSVTLYFPESFGGKFGQSVIGYIGLYGEITEQKREKALNVVYELQPNPALNKTPGMDSVSKTVQ